MQIKEESWVQVIAESRILHLYVMSAPFDILASFVIPAPHQAWPCESRGAG